MPDSINKSINLILQTISRSPSFNSLNKVYRNWDSVVNKKYLKYCYPEKININFEEKIGSLFVVSYNPATSFYLNNNKDYILAKINTYFGYNSIISLHIKELPMIIKEEYVKKQKKDLTKEQIDFVNSIKGDDKLSKALRHLAYTYYSYET